MNALDVLTGFILACAAYMLYVLVRGMNARERVPLTMQQKVSAVIRLQAAATIQRDQLIQKMIAECPHDVESCRKLPCSITALDFPWLICLDCGLAEECWGAGPDKLKHAEFKVADITLDDFSSNALHKVYQKRA